MIMAPQNGAAIKVMVIGMVMAMEEVIAGVMATATAMEEVIAGETNNII